MKKQWYFKQGDTIIGPVSSAELKRRANIGELKPETAVRRSDQESFIPARRLNGLFGRVKEQQAAGATQMRRAKPAEPKVRSRQSAGTPTTAYAPAFGTTAKIATVALLVFGSASVGLIWRSRKPDTPKFATDLDALPVDGSKAETGVGDVSSRESGLADSFSGQVGSVENRRPPPSSEELTVSTGAVEHLRAKLDLLQPSTSRTRSIRTRRILIPRGPGAVMAATVGDNLGRALQSGFDARTQSEESNRLGSKRVAEARRVFWSLYPNRPGFDEASAIFAEELFRKDVVMLLRHGMVRVTSSGNPFDAKPDFSLLTQQILEDTEKYDNGIAPGASGLFSNWVDTSFPTSRTMTFANLNGAERALNDYRELYDSYVLKRDRYEFWKAGREPDLFPTAESMARYIARVGLAMSPRSLGSASPPMNDDQASNWIELMRRLFGNDAFEQVFDQIRFAKKNEGGGLEDPTKFGLHSMNNHLGFAALELLGRQSTENYLAWLNFNRPDPKAEIKALIKKHGKDAIYGIAKQLRDAPKREGDFEIVLTSQAASDLQIASVRVQPAFLQLIDRLSFSDTRLKLRGLPNQVDGVQVAGDGYSLHGHSRGGRVAYDGERILLLRQHVESQQNIELVVFDARRQKHLFTVAGQYPVSKSGSSFAGPPIVGDSPYVASAFSGYAPGKYRNQGIVKLFDTASRKQLPEILGPEPPASERSEWGYAFGAAVALDGDYIAIGAPKRPIKSPKNVKQFIYDAGCVYVYRGGSNVPIYELRPESHFFGRSGSRLEFGSSLIARDGVLIVVLARASTKTAAVAYDIETGEKLVEIDRTEGDLYSSAAAFCDGHLAMITVGKAPIISRETKPEDKKYISVAVHQINDGSPIFRMHKKFEYVPKLLLMSKRHIGVTDRRTDGLLVFDRETGADLGEIPFNGETNDQAEIDRAPGTMCDLDGNNALASGSKLTLLGNHLYTGHCMWYLDLNDFED